MKRIWLAALFFGLIGTFPVASQAATASPMLRERVEERVETRIENREERQTERQENRTERLSDRCDAINEKIDERLTKFDEGKARHIEQHQHLQQKLTQLVMRLEAEGKDVTQLKADLVVLDGKVKAFAQNYQAFIEQLRAARTYSCGRSEGEFKAALQRSRELLQVVRESAKDVWSYYSRVIRPEIKSITDKE